MRLTRSVALAAALALGTLVLPGRALAQGSKGADAQPAGVAVEVVVITANASGRPSDPRLARIAKRLENTPFNSFQQVGQQVVTLRPSALATVALTNNRRLDLRPTKIDRSGQVALLVQLFGKTGAKLVDAEAVLPSQQDFMVAGPKDEDGTLMVYLRHAGAAKR